MSSSTSIGSADSAAGSSQESTFKAWRPAISGRRHAISTGHYLASHAGFEILQAGGNAIDAGVAAGLVLGVVHSDQVNVAGVAPMIVWMADRGELVSIDGVGSWPAGASCELFIREHGGQLPEGLLRTVIPAAPAAWIEALTRYGTMSFGEVARSAVGFAREGFVMYPFLAEQLHLAACNNARWPSNREIYLPEGKSPTVGDIFIQRDLAKSLQYMIDEEAAAIGRGSCRISGLQAARDAFYRGDLMRAITNFHAENGGLLTEEDMATYRVKLAPTVSTRFGDLDVHSCGFWSQGPALLQALNILASFDLNALGHNRVEYIHVVVEALKLAFADREGFYGDPDVIHVPAEMLLSSPYAEMRRMLIQKDRAWPGLPPAGNNIKSSAVTGAETETGPFDTSYVAVVDRQGNAISICPSDTCSDTIIIPGTGLAPSSRGSQSWADPKHPSSVAPGKRPRLTPNPAMVFRQGKMTMPIGSPGGDSQIQAVLQVLLNMSVFGMDPQTAVEEPRFVTYSHPDSFAPHTAFPGRLCLEGRFSNATVDALSELGHKVVLWPDRLWRAGGVCLVRHDLDSGVRECGADPRRAAAYALGW
ncbi:MAG: gamma-glutamyltransferase family protein [Mesorhizobium sp.]|uniref:gamma-glutamyltransferase family protein n=1 Tax=Mesorhizobium sp. TaxID=1871066 RepID=UPI000FE74D53|nr:gamma-glutamyltransferase family protein [Mesorhizobium sp.]RWA95930.1 MAG: gamma-glutamyltransferase family protein [Mesorhizobium sp.]RWK56776.1 MAG: gamma-glutamyltransferase family protein [Mesorhizobium sp.]RWM40543.1 MAG: gamma-glutamyltransferase family protein [Mesorhizobium sp.]RWM44090.1 MAG: gamma-glutamyltransferase family protein [Mesorhizobium sp.]RWO21549.1 MAG: gamma-glutamyltransferase family protein [Mesorhizobium sp.]